MRAPRVGAAPLGRRLLGGAEPVAGDRRRMGPRAVLRPAGDLHVHVAAVEGDDEVARRPVPVRRRRADGRPATRQPGGHRGLDVHRPRPRLQGVADGDVRGAPVRRRRPGRLWARPRSATGGASGGSVASGSGGDGSRRWLPAGPGRRPRLPGPGWRARRASVAGSGTFFFFFLRTGQHGAGTGSRRRTGFSAGAALLRAARVLVPFGAAPRACGLRGRDDAGADLHGVAAEQDELGRVVAGFDAADAAESVRPGNSLRITLAISMHHPQGDRQHGLARVAAGRGVAFDASAPGRSVSRSTPSTLRIVLIALMPSQPARKRGAASGLRCA